MSDKKNSPHGVPTTDIHFGSPDGVPAPAASSPPSPSSVEASPTSNASPTSSRRDPSTLRRPDPYEQQALSNSVKKFHTSLDLLCDDVEYRMTVLGGSDDATRLRVLQAGAIDPERRTLRQQLDLLRYGNTIDEDKGHLMKLRGDLFTFRELYERKYEIGMTASRVEGWLRNIDNIEEADVRASKMDAMVWQHDQSNFWELLDEDEKRRWNEAEGKGSGRSDGGSGRAAKGSGKGKKGAVGTKERGGSSSFPPVGPDSPAARGMPTGPRGGPRAGAVRFYQEPEQDEFIPDRGEFFSEVVVPRLAADDDFAEYYRGEEVAVARFGRPAMQRPVMFMNRERYARGLRESASPSATLGGIGGGAVR